MAEATAIWLKAQVAASLQFTKDNQVLVSALNNHNMRTKAKYPMLADFTALNTGDKFRLEFRKQWKINKHDCTLSGSRG